MKPMIRGATGLKEDYNTIIGAQDYLKGKMFVIGSMGETPIEEMVEGCKEWFTASTPWL